jgi:hypothetical protein
MYATMLILDTVLFFLFLGFWNRFELWGFYDKQFGKISDMEPSNYGLFTASHLRKAKN